MSENSREVEDHPGVAPFLYRLIGPIAEHNYLCSVCRDKPGVIELWHGLLQPCWECQKEYKLIKLTWFDRLLKRGLK